MSNYQPKESRFSPEAEAQIRSLAEAFEVDADELMRRAPERMVNEGPLTPHEQELRDAATARMTKLLRTLRHESPDLES